MRRGAIRINNYFAKQAADRTDLQPEPRANEVFRALMPLGRKDLLISEAVGELAAAWQLGIVTDARQDEMGVVWTIDGQHLFDSSGEGIPQASEQLAAVLAATAEGFEHDSYKIEVSGTSVVAQYIDVFSTTHNALLARSLGVLHSLVAHEWRQLSLDASMNETLRTRAREANELTASHGMRRMYKIQREGGKMMKKMTKEPVAQMEMVDQLTVWRHVQNAGVYKLSWYVELTDGKPVHIACSIERGTESQRAVVETYMSLANRQLRQAGAQGVVSLGLGVQSGCFGEDSPINEFTIAFATTFLTTTERAQIGLENNGLASQTDLLQSIDAVACERCSNPIQQFGTYGICLHCGDAQKVKN